MMYAEIVDKVEGKIVPKECVRRLKSNICSLYISKGRIREAESYKDHVIGVTQEFDKLLPQFKHRLIRTSERIQEVLKIRLSSKDVIKAIALPVILHDHGKVYKAYQEGRSPSYRHEVVSSAFIYRLLKEKLKLNFIIAAHLSLAVLLHHQPRTYKLLEDFNQYLITQSMLLEILKGLKDEDFKLSNIEREELADVIKSSLTITSGFNKTLIDELVNYIVTYFPKVNDIVRDIIIIQSIHVGLPNAEIRRLLRFFTAMVNHMIIICDNITAYRNRAKEPECVKSCGSTLGAIFSLIYG